MAVADIAFCLQLLGLRGREAWLDSQVTTAYNELAEAQLEEGYTERAAAGYDHFHAWCRQSGVCAVSSIRMPCVRDCIVSDAAAVLTSSAHLSSV